jgi:hypothetical protein
MLIAVPLFLGFRALCLHTLVGFRYGTNRSLGFRFRSDIFGTVSQLASVGNWPPLFLGLVLFGLIVGLRWRAARRDGFDRLPVWEWLLWITGAALLLALLALPQFQTTAYFTHNLFDLAVALDTYLEPTTLRLALVVALFIGAIAHLLRMKPRLALFCYTWVLLVFLPLLASPAVIHRFYLMNAGYALLLGGGLTWWVEPAKPVTNA